MASILIHTRTLMVLIAAAPLLTSMLAAEPAAPAAPSAESATPPASLILKREVLRGTDYDIDEHVTLQGDRYVFTLRTAYGSLGATGIDMLELRLTELAALRQATQMSRQSQELAGVKENLRKTGQGLHDLLTDPVDTLGSVPKGVGRSLESLTQKSTYQGGESRRELATRLGCDPETRNELLRKKLDQISLRRSLGKGLTSVATLGLTGGAALAAQGASAIRTTAEMRDALRATPLYKINDGIEKDLRALGVPKKAGKQFSRHPQFTTLQRLQFMGQFNRLRGVADRPHLIDVANAARSEEEALAAIHGVALLAGVHARRPLAGIAPMPFPAATDTKGRSWAVLAVDYLSTGPNLDMLLEQLSASKAPVVICAGRVSEQARAALTDRGIIIVERGDLDALPAGDGIPTRPSQP